MPVDAKPRTPTVAAPQDQAAADPFSARLSRALQRAKQEAGAAASRRVAVAAEEVRQSFVGRVQAQLDHPIFASTDETWCVDSANA